MNASELRAGVYGGAVIIKGDKGFTVAYNHEVKRCSELPWNAKLDEFKGSCRDKDFIVQYDSEVELVTAENLDKFMKVAVIQNKDVTPAYEEISHNPSHAHYGHGWDYLRC